MEVKSPYKAMRRPESKMNNGFQITSSRAKNLKSSQSPKCQLQEKSPHNPSTSSKNSETMGHMSKMKKSVISRNKSGKTYKNYDIPKPNEHRRN